MKIEPGRIINDFIEPNKRQYAIPVYQRNYEWSKEQCTKLFQDIVLAYKKDKTHFCGAVVYAPLKEENNVHYYIIIDGQQRLTTIYLLLKALLDCADSDGTKSLLSESIFNIDKFDTYDITEASKLKLKPIKSDNNQLILLMDNKYEEVDKSTGIYHNYELFCSLIRNEMTKDPDLSVKDIYRGIEKLICAKIRLESDDNPQEIFERINSTGVPLSLADKIRNFVLMTDKNQEELYETYWLEIEKMFSKEQLKDFFLDYLNFKIDGFAKEETAYNIFKNLFYTEQYSNESILKEILHYAKMYHGFLYADSYSQEINNVLSSLQKLKQTTVFVFLFSIFDDYKNEIITEDELLKVLKFILHYSIRRIICEISSNSLRGLFKTLYQRLFNIEENKNHYYDTIISFFLQLTTKDALPDEENFKTALMQKNLYRKNALCKYLLSSIENQGKEIVSIDNLTIEHVMPQNKNISTAWQKMLGSDWQQVWETNLHTLGNLTLTAYNSELGDKTFEEKKKMLSDVNSKIVTLNSDIISCSEWNAQKILTRAERLSKEIITLFPIEEPKQKIQFLDPKYKLYTIDNPDDATGKVPNYFTLLGETINISNFADLYREVISILYEKDNSIIENISENNEKIIPWSQIILFSKDKTKVRNPHQIADSEVYAAMGFSASYIVYFIQSLLDIYNIDRTDFVYSAKES